jgi:hypothetical protein
MEIIPRHIHWQTYEIGMPVFNSSTNSMSSITAIAENGSEITVGKITYPWGHRLYHSKEDYQIHKRCTDKSLLIYHKFLFGSLPIGFQEYQLDEIISIMENNVLTK